jgi:NAD(P)-dependent dehydrogenase (short-subunit alcohol dehydrogenase family)
MDLGLANRSFLVTGAASGIGRATAEVLMREGARVAVLDLDQQQLDDVVRELGGHGKAIAVLADVSDEDQVRRAVAAAVAELGGLHGVVNSAGVNSTSDGAVCDVASELLVRMVGVNLVGTFHVAKLTIPHLIEAGGGTVVSVSSAGALPGVKVGGSTAYNAGKAGIIGLNRSIASQYADRNIRSVAVCPGPVDTPMLATATRKLGQEVYGARTLARAAAPEEIATLIAYLLSDRGSFVSGSTWGIDGNLTGY